MRDLFLPQFGVFTCRSVGRYTFDTALQGILFEHDSSKHSVKVIGGRIQRDIDENQYARHTYGGRFQQKFNDKFSLGSNLVTIDDQEASILSTESVAAIDNNIKSIDFSWRPDEYWEIDSEYAWSSYDMDVKDRIADVNGTALNTSANYRKNKFEGRYNYGRIGSEFHSEYGNVIPDRIVHESRMMYTFSPKLDITGTFRWYKDNLNKGLDFTSMVQSPGGVINIRPFEGDKREFWNSVQITSAYDETRNWDNLYNTYTNTRNFASDFSQSYKTLRWNSRYELQETDDHLFPEYNEKVIIWNHVINYEKTVKKVNISCSSSYLNEDNSPNLNYNRTIINRTVDMDLNVGFTFDDYRSARLNFNKNDYDSGIIGEDLSTFKYSLEYNHVSRDDIATYNVVYRITDYNYETFIKDFEEHYFGVGLIMRFE